MPWASRHRQQRCISAPELPWLAIATRRRYVTLLPRACCSRTRAASPAAGDAVHGARLYEERCGGCHAVDANRVGPLHRNVYGRKAGAALAYDYSPALRDSTVRWDEATLEAWLANPERLIPGQRMGYAVSNAGDRGDLIAYLRSVSNP